MEYTFGFLFGAALGLCALHLRDRLEPLGTPRDNQYSAQEAPVEAQRRIHHWALTLLAAIVVVLGVFQGWRLVVGQLFPILRELSLGDLRRTSAQVLFGFTGIGCVLMLLGRRWQTVAWQVAISVTIVAAAIDWQRDLLSRGGIIMHENYRNLLVLSLAAISILVVQFWQHRHVPKLMDIFLFAICSLMGIGYMMGLAWSDIWWPNLDTEAAVGGRPAFLWKKFRGEVVVHLIFTTLFMVSISAAMRERRRTLR